MTQREYLEEINTKLMAELVKNEKALPPGFNRQRFCLNCISVIKDMLTDPKKVENLNGIDTESIVTTLIKGAYLGLDFFNGECYAIPYKGQIKFQTDYKGELKLCKKYSKNKIKDIFAKLVREGDEFYEEVDSGDQKIVYKPKPFSESPIKGVFAVVKYMDGSMMYETMSLAEVEKVRNTYSKAKNSQAWTDSYGEMVKKTCLRRLCKFIDLDFDSIEAMSAFRDGGDADFGQISTRSQKSSEILDVSAQIQQANQAQLPDHGQKPTVQQMTQSKQKQPVPNPADARPVELPYEAEEFVMG